MQAIMDYHDCDMAHGQYVFMPMVFFFLFCLQYSNIHANYVTCVLSKLQTITKDQFVANLIEL
jgi:hypothetical protein